MPAAGRPSISALVQAGVLDAELAGLLSLLLEARVPAIVAGPAGPARDTLVDALVGLLPPGARVVDLAGDAEEFEWLPEATELGWRREHPVVPARGRDAPSRASSATTVLLTRDLAGEGAAATGGARARLAVRALALGYGLIAGITAEGLEGVLARLHETAIGTDEDERSRLGIVLAIGEPPARPRVCAAHYVRPLARDTHGHVQRLPPAVLATWNPDTNGFDHFAWGVLPELASRTGHTPIEFEREQARRATELLRATPATAR